MRIIFVTVLCLLAFGVAAAQTDDAPWRTGVTSPRLERLLQETAQGKPNALVDFWVEMKKNGGPLIEPIAGDPRHVLLSFVFQGGDHTRGVALYCQLGNIRDPVDNGLGNLSGTDVWFKTYALRSDLRFSYSFAAYSALSVSGAPTPQADPLNPKRLAPDTGVGLSYVELPGASLQPWIVQDQKKPQRKLITVHVESVEVNDLRTIEIYLPAAFNAKPVTVPYPLIVLFDGEEYADPSYIPTAETLDNLTAAGKLPPVVAVFIHQAPQPRRNHELTNDDPFLNFVTDEVLPDVRRDYHATSDPRQTVVVGSSTGGLAAAFFALRHPDVYGNVLSQSGALWPGHTREDPGSEWLTRQYKIAAKLPIHFVLQVGTLERWNTPGNRLSILDANRHLRDVLRAKGYQVEYAEMGGGHEPLSWRGGLAEGLIQLLGSK
jgi:enterochelin esterase family protein